MNLIARQANDTENSLNVMAGDVNGLKLWKVICLAILSKVGANFFS